MSSVSAFKADVRAFQSILNSFGADLKEDGVFGPRSAMAVSVLDQKDRRLVKSLADRLSIQIPSILSWTEVSNLIQEAAQRHKVPKLFLQRTIMIENVTSAQGVLIDTLGKHRGLGQFDQPTWKAVTCKPWTRVSDPRDSVNAIAKLYLMNEKSFRSTFPSGSYTLETAYLYHNQGAKSAERFLKEGELVYPNQSPEAVETVQLARRQHVNNRNPNRIITRFV